jgi:hypothetical protein
MEILDRKDAINHHEDPINHDEDAINRRLYNERRFIASLALTQQDWLRGRAVIG